MLLSVRDWIVFSKAVLAENDDYYTVAIIMIKTKKQQQEMLYILKVAVRQITIA